ncbi:hypothetical protein B4U37_01915 [Sutcliffiella horikoshii]|uniref:DUF4367 domain-containing protein n=1 Tax=Sutcliffiella horikoshii TaxID=79883 RepID=A0ABM6KEH7_9BACI|nr:hypothetical protein [Sutcliffiella horikoshii]ART74878.1 hypothetical protein B4U37_01915 [Sutcliffiella horikoshii]
MDKVEEKLKETDKKRRIFTLLIVVFIIGAITIPFIKLPVNAAGLLVPFKVESATYVPIDVEKQYSKISGFNRVKTIYENQEESITVWATSEIGWNNVSNWDEQITLYDGTTAYYNVIDDNVHMISWRKDEVEYAIDYKGAKEISKEKLIKMVQSIE